MVYCNAYDSALNDFVRFTVGFCDNTAMATGYTVTASNMLVKLNDATAGVTGKNTMGELLGKENYQTVKETSQAGSDRVLQMGLLNPDLYGTNKNVGNISQNAAYDNGEGTTVHNINDLNDEQIASLIKYTGDDYAGINNSLRGMEILTPDNRDTVVIMKSILNNSELPQDMTLYKGASTEALDISSISQYTMEAEVLFNAGQEMLITSAEIKDGILYISVIIE